MNHLPKLNKLCPYILMNAILSFKPLLKIIALLVVLALHLFHPAGQAAALPLSLLVLIGVWLTEASIAGGSNWSTMGMAMIGPTTMPFYLGVLFFNAVVAAHLPPPVTANDGIGPVYVSKTTKGPIPGPPQSGCGAGCGSSSGGGCSASGGCGSAGGCGGGCGSHGKGTSPATATAKPPRTTPKPVAPATASVNQQTLTNLATSGRVPAAQPDAANSPSNPIPSSDATLAQLRAQLAQRTAEGSLSIPPPAPAPATTVAPALKRPEPAATSSPTAAPSAPPLPQVTTPIPPTASANKP